MEMVKHDIFKTRIYPLPARGSRSVRLCYETRVAPAEDGTAEYVHHVPATIAKGVESLSVKVCCVGFDVDSPPQVEQVEGDPKPRIEFVWKGCGGGPGECLSRLCLLLVVASCRRVLSSVRIVASRSDPLHGFPHSNGGLTARACW